MIYYFPEYRNTRSEQYTEPQAPAFFVCVCKHSPRVKTVLRFRSYVELCRGEGQEGFGDRGNASHFPSVAFTLQSLPFLSINSFCISSDQTFCPPSLGSPCQQVYRTQVGARTIENGKWDGHFLHFVCVAAREGTDLWRQPERLFSWIGCPGFHLFTPRCPVGEDTDAQRPLASAAATVRRKKCKDRQH